MPRIEVLEIVFHSEDNETTAVLLLLLFKEVEK
jgi:hypothetical protein